jgi:hypothetical protein
MEQINQFRANHGAERIAENPGLKANTHACRASRRGLQQANDRLKRANRDLGEAAAFIAASLTTVTAAEAVINIAVDKIGLSRAILQPAFDVYIAIIAVICLWGILRVIAVTHRRAKAESDIDQAKHGIFEFCPGDQWPRLEE